MQVGELWVKLGLDRVQFERGLKETKKETRTFGSTLGSVLRSAAGVALGVGLWEGLRQGIQGATKMLFGYNVQMEQARIGFTTMLGSAQQADAFLRQLADFAARTPFEFPELVEASKRMLALGFSADQVIPTLTAVGNAAAGLGTGQEGINRIITALGQMQAKAKVSHEEMMQLTEAGVPAWEILAEATGKPIPVLMKLAQDGLLPANEAVNMLVEGMGKRFPDMMKQMEKTIPGLLSTIKDSLVQTFGELTKPQYEKVRQFLEGVRDALQRFAETAKTSGLKEALIELAPALEPLINFGDWIIKNWKTIGTILASTLGTFLAYKAISGIAFAAFTNFEKLRYSLTLFKMGLRDVPGLIGKIRTAFLMLTGANPILLAISAAIVGITIASIYLYKNWDKVKYYGLQAWGTLKVYVLNAIDAMLAGMEKLVGWIPLLGDKIRQARGSIGALITKEQATMSVRTAEYAAAQAEKEAARVKAAVSSASAGVSAAAARAGKAVSDFGDAADKAGKKASKAAEDTRTVWEKTADVLNTRLEIVKAQYDAAAARLGENASETEKLTLKLSYLKREYDIQSQIVKNAAAAYEAARKSKKANTEELLKLQLNLEQARAQQAKLAAEIRSTRDALDEQASGLDGLNFRLSVLRAQYDIAKAKLGENATEAEKLAVDHKYLAEQLDLQNRIVAVLSQRYKEVAAAKGEDSKAAQELYSKLLDAQKAQAELERDLRATTNAIAEQARKLDEYKTKVGEVAAKYRQDLADALKEYQDKVAQVNQQLVEEEKKLTEQYRAEVDKRARALVDWVGLFDAVPKRAQVSGQQLLENLRGQVDAFKAWQELISQLAARGIDEGLLAELRNMGPKASEELAALLTLTDEELAEYVALWREKNQLAYAQATSELEGLRIDTEAKIAELRANAAVQLEQYRLEWEEKNREIRENTVAELKKLVEEAGKLGSAFVLAVAEGIKTFMPELAAALAGLPGFALISDTKEAEAQAEGTVAAADKQKSGVLAAIGKQKAGVLQAWAEIAVQLATKNQEISTTTITSWQQLQQQLFALWQKILQDATVTWTNMQKLIFTVTGEIQNRFTALEAAATNWGRNLMGNFIAGIWSQYDRLVDTLQAMMETAQAYLGFASPTEKGPGRYADEWGPGLVKTFVEGIRAELPKLETVSTEVVAAIRAPVVNVTAPTAVAAGGNTIVVNINGAQNPEAIWNYLRRELVRAGVRL